MIKINPTIEYIIIIFAILLGSFLLIKILKYLLGKYLEKHTKDLDNDSTNYNFLKHAISFFILIGATISIFYTIPSLRELGLTLLASAGLAAAIIGLAAQQAFSNIVSGVFIVIFKPFRVGDFIEIADKRGIVEDITLRHTVIRNIENRRMIIPNSVISNETIINANIKDLKICNLMDIGISYDSDVNIAIDIIQKQGLAHPNCIDTRSDKQKEANDPVIPVRVLGYGESSVNLRAYIWSKDSWSGFLMKCDLYKSIKEEFDKNNIEIPFPHRTLVYKKERDKNEIS